MQICVQHITVILLCGTNCNMPVYSSLPKPVCLSISKFSRQKPHGPFSYKEYIPIPKVFCHIHSSSVFVFGTQNMCLTTWMADTDLSSIIKACSNKGGGAGPKFMLKDINLNSNIEERKFERNGLNPNCSM